MLNCDFTKLRSGSLAGYEREHGGHDDGYDPALYPPSSPPPPNSTTAGFPPDNYYPQTNNFPPPPGGGYAPPSDYNPADYPPAPATSRQINNADPYGYKPRESYEQPMESYPPPGEDQYANAPRGRRAEDVSSPILTSPSGERSEEGAFGFAPMFKEVY